MKKTIALLVASTALTAAIVLPAWSAVHSPADIDDRPIAAAFDAGNEAHPLILVSNDDDDDDDDDDGACGGVRQAAPAGTVAPPQNGLFGNGVPPRVQVK